ncbi:MAG: 50S ribosomal protein L6 [Patescibacteria group bacterium]
MSRIGKQPIPLPSGVTITVKAPDVTIVGPKGTIALRLHHRMNVAVEGSTATVNVPSPDNRNDRALWGLGRQLLANAVEGVSKGFEKRLEITGVGFKAAVQPTGLLLNLGFSHPINFAAPTGITLTVEKNVIVVSGVDKQAVGEVAATIRRLKPPEPYKGKGIKYAGEVIRRKAGKVMKAAGAK